MAIEKAVAEINKRFGEGSVIRLGDNQSVVKVELIPSGSLTLDIALGGGVPRGRIIEIFGPESSGKTTLSLHILAEAQRLGLECAFIDMEHALDPVYTEKIGVDIDNLYLSQPDNGETALEICEALIRSGVGIVVVDSVAALVPKSEIDGDMGDAPMGMQARLMSQAMRKLSGAVSTSKAVLIFTNQLRQKIGVIYGSNETTTGGNALKFYASQRLDIRRIQSLKEGQDVVGSRTRVRVVKNKIAPPFKVAEFDIMYGEGISKIGEVLELGVSVGAVSKRGSYFYIGEERIGQGKENAKAWLIANPTVVTDVEKQIKEKAASGHTIISNAEDMEEV